MDGQQSFDGFEFDDHFVFDDEINLVAAVQQQSFVQNGKIDLALELQFAKTKFVAKALLVS